MALHLFSQGWNFDTQTHRPGYGEWRHAQQCWCVSKSEDVVGFGPYYRYAYFERTNPSPPDFSQHTAEAIT